MTSGDVQPVTVNPTATRLVATGPVEVRFGYDQRAQRTVTFGPRTHGHHDLTVNGVPVSINIRFHENDDRSWNRNYSRHDVRRIDTHSVIEEASTAARTKIYDTLSKLVPGLAEAHPERFQTAVADHAGSQTWADEAATLRNCADVADAYHDLHHLVASGTARLDRSPHKGTQARCRTTGANHRGQPALKRCTLVAHVVTTSTQTVIGFAVCSDRNQHRLELIPAHHIIFDDEQDMSTR